MQPLGGRCENRRREDATERSDGDELRLPGASDSKKSGVFHFQRLQHGNAGSFGDHFYGMER